MATAQGRVAETGLAVARRSTPPGKLELFSYLSIGALSALVTAIPDDPAWWARIISGAFTPSCFVTAGMVWFGGVNRTQGGYVVNTLIRRYHIADEDISRVELRRKGFASGMELVIHRHDGKPIRTGVVDAGRMEILAGLVSRHAEKRSTAD